MLELDPKHQSFDLFNDQITLDIWREKYAQPDEQNPYHTFSRVCMGVYKNDTMDHNREALDAMFKGLWMPGGRILSSAGVETNATLMNCYVSKTIEDSIPGIMEALDEACRTLSMYGGIGMDFSTIRPKGALIKRTGLESPGVITWMKLWNAMSSSIMQAGHRRGAMMGVIRDNHPDLPAFIKAKQTAGELTNFNVSVLISDKFMQAVKDNSLWCLRFPIPPAVPRSKDLVVTDWIDENKVKQYTYETIPARKLWEDITRSTYEFSEPGVIFISRINDLNNLKYCETISCTNPCGEQPLPPYGTCNLGAVNLARMVLEPFTDKARFNFNLLREVVRIGVRFLDNVIDVTHYPLPQQREEERAKRRLGLGVSGLADALAQLGIAYNSKEALIITNAIMQGIATQAYITSGNLANERGTFPLYSESILTDKFVQHLAYLAPSVLSKLRDTGLRNGVLLTVAPTGTTSILFGNISSGIEPVFQHKTKRKVWQNNTDTKEYISYGFGARFYQHCHKMDLKINKLPDYMDTADQVSIDQHVRMQGICQEWVDASISKTINCPANISYEDFVKVYDMAYEHGCKGCTTYRPSAVRGAVLEAVDNTEGVPEVNKEPTLKEVLLKTAKESKEISKSNKRPKVLVGCTYKVAWPSLNSNLYLTINEHEGKPYEVFIKSKDLKLVEWTTVVSGMISRELRSGQDPMLVADDFKQIQGSHDGQWIEGKFYSSIITYIGYLLEQHFNQYKKIGPSDAPLSGAPSTPQEGIKCFCAYGVTKEYWKCQAQGCPYRKVISSGFVPEQTPIFDVNMACPKCMGPMHKEEGCEKCEQCGYSKCG